MNRGDVWLADLGDQIGHEQRGQRPVLVVSAEPWLASNPPVVTVIAITGRPSSGPLRIELDTETSGLRTTSYVRVEDQVAISPARLRHRAGRASVLELRRVDVALRRILGL